MAQSISQGLAGVPATHSNISYIDGQKGILEYRGFPIEELAENSTFEETAYLLLYGNLPDQKQLAEFSAYLKKARTLPPIWATLARDFPYEGSAMDGLQAMTATQGMVDPESLQQDKHMMSARMISTLPIMAATWGRVHARKEPVAPHPELDHAANFLYMLTGEIPDPLHARILDRCLILHAEHTINASTFTALVVASTLARPWAVISAAIGALSGDLHGGANERTLQMLMEIGSADKAEAYVDAKLAKKEKIWGMGHRVYKVKDPRAVILHKFMEELAHSKGLKHHQLFDTALKVEEVVAKRLADKGVYPNVDFFSGVLYHELGIPSQLFTPIFAISRVSGWVAHWREQIEDNRIIRPTQVYTGDHGLSYVPIATRG